jgi:amino acid transporter, AAT family
VVLTAALSSANTNLYLTSRMLYSLARGGYAPSRLGQLTRRGIPLWALLASSLGMAVAVLAQRCFPKQAYLSMVGAAFFGGLFVWAMILLTHLHFRRMRQGMPGFAAFLPAFPYANWLALLGLMVVGASTLFVPGMRITLLGGLPWLGLISLAYILWRASHASDSESP